MSTIEDIQKRAQEYKLEQKAFLEKRETFKEWLKNTHPGVYNKAYNSRILP